MSGSRNRRAILQSSQSLTAEQLVASHIVWIYRRGKAVSSITYVDLLYIYIAAGGITGSYILNESEWATGLKAPTCQAEVVTSCSTVTAWEHIIDNVTRSFGSTVISLRVRLKP